jgi:MFS family permease
MFSEMLSDKFRITAKNTIINIVLVTNAFVWYYLAIKILYDISLVTVMDPFTTQLMWTIHFTGIIFSAIAGASLTNKIKDKTRFFMLWMALGVTSSIISLAVDTTYIPNVLGLSLLWGLSLGLGMPSCMGYLAKSIQIENRARVGGIILFLSGVGFAVFGTTASDSISLQMTVLSAWRIFGLAFFLIFRQRMENPDNNKPPSYKSLVGQRNFLLYLVPWIMFSLITCLTIPVQSQIVDLIKSRTPEVPSVEFLRGIENVLAGVFAVVGGFLADIVGRKRISIVAFASLGLAYSALGIYPENILSWYLYTVIDGIAWGLLFVIFVVTVWGDLGGHMPSDKYYAVGVAPFFISKALQFTIGNDIANAIPNSAIFSFTAFFLFLAVLPLFYAPETLPEKTMKDRELKIYIEKAEKIKQKYA